MNLKRMLMILTSLLLLSCVACSEPVSTPTPTITPTQTPIPLSAVLEMSASLSPTTLASGQSAELSFTIRNQSEEMIAFDELFIELPYNFLKAFVVTRLYDCNLDPGFLGRFQTLTCPLDDSLPPNQEATEVIPLVALTPGNYEGVLDVEISAHGYGGEVEHESHETIIITP